MDFKPQKESEIDPEELSQMTVIDPDQEDDEDPELLEEEPVKKRKKSDPPVTPTGAIPFESLKRLAEYRFAIQEEGVNKMITGTLSNKVTLHSSGMLLKIRRQYKDRVESEILDVIAVFAKKC